MPETYHNFDEVAISNAKAQARLKLNASLTPTKSKDEIIERVSPTNPNVKEAAGHVISRAPVVTAGPPPPPNSNSRSLQRRKDGERKHKKLERNGGSDDSDSDDGREHKRRAGNDGQVRRRAPKVATQANIPFSKAEYTDALSQDERERMKSLRELRMLGARWQEVRRTRNINKSTRGRREHELMESMPLNSSSYEQWKLKSSEIESAELAIQENMIRSLQWRPDKAQEQAVLEITIGLFERDLVGKIQNLFETPGVQQGRCFSARAVLLDSTTPTASHIFSKVCHKNSNYFDCSEAAYITHLTQDPEFCKYVSFYKAMDMVQKTTDFSVGVLRRELNLSEKSNPFRKGTEMR